MKTILAIKADKWKEYFPIPGRHAADLVVGRVWHDGRRQARLARLPATTEVAIEPLTDQRARAAGQLCGVSKTRDVIDASVVLASRAHGHAIVTSDPDDLVRLDPNAELIIV